MKRFRRPMLLAVYLGLFAVVLSFYPGYRAAAQTTPSIPVKAANTTKATAAATTATISVPVTVVNTPLPVTGNVNASVNGTVNANITNASVPVKSTVNANITNAAVPVSGTVNANITNTPSVNVSSLPAVQLAAGTTVGVTGGTFSLANTSATPIFTRDVNSPTNQPFAASICITNFGPSCPGTADPTQFVVPVTGANSNPVLMGVIEYYSSYCVGVTQPSDSAFLDLSARTAGKDNSFYISPVLSSGVYYSNQQTRIYVDPGTPVHPEISREAGSNATCYVTISGYLVTQ